MAARMLLNPTRPLQAPKGRRIVHQSPCPRYSSDFSHLHEEMLLREPLHVTDFILPPKSRTLSLTLQDFLPKPNKRSDETTSSLPLRFAHHLVYFPFLQTTSKLLPDGTETWHSPGPPFTRRMWVGGDMVFQRSIAVDGLHPFHCIASIKDVQVRGNEGQEKVFVKVQHAMYPNRPSEHQSSDWSVMENRTLIFMRDCLQVGSPTANYNVLRPTWVPDFSHTIVPTRELLFRFSALTFNAHAIHLDKSYCREIEGHRNLLVHGPLTVVLMVEVLQVHLQNLAQSSSPSSTRSIETITHLEYKNLVPLYAEEQMRICVRRKGRGRHKEIDKTWDVWIEGQDGGYAVKATVRTFRQKFTEEESIPKANIAPQNEINPTQEDVANENDTLGEDV